MRPPPDEPRRNPKKGPFFPRVLKVTVFPSVREPLERESRLEQETFLEILLTSLISLICFARSSPKRSVVIFVDFEHTD